MQREAKLVGLLVVCLAGTAIAQISGPGMTTQYDIVTWANSSGTMVGIGMGNRADKYDRP
jgi:hypothetical protein